MTSFSVKIPTFYSREDEENFFAWLKKISAVIGVKGLGKDLIIELENDTISDSDLREIIALFYRHNLEMKMLEVFLNDNNKSWFFDNADSYWHKSIFERRKSVTLLKSSDQSEHRKYLKKAFSKRDDSKEFPYENMREYIARNITRIMRSDHKTQILNDIKFVLDKNRENFSGDYYNIDQMFLVVRNRPGDDNVHVLDLLDERYFQRDRKEF